MVGYTTFLSPVIESECEFSVGKDGFLVDLYNTKNWKTPTTIVGSEHRNVLYLLSQMNSIRYA